jgi:hypothetical protein
MEKSVTLTDSDPQCPADEDAKKDMTGKKNFDDFYIQQF